ncbi:hypothetical protein BW686_20245 [Pseudomonas syringae]|uniref:Uncharacterized protein n=1 Tax=Pseudomonas syringae TaxID=317 RepID=A0A244EMK9_PSESX|nr:hypothetical protein [Pseudomonas syringae]OUM05688.1 hypothetical protein BW686_20245 [Pseudomonas syringae]
MKNFRMVKAALVGAAAMCFITPLWAKDGNEALSAVIDQQRKQLPITLDIMTRIDDITYADHTVTYNLTLSGYSGKPGEKAYYNSYLTQQIHGSLCKQTAYLLVLELGNKITYSYTSSTGGFITSITLSREDCE